jgi:hypothetical protein
VRYRSVAGMQKPRIEYFASCQILHIGRVQHFHDRFSTSRVSSVFRRLTSPALSISISLVWIVMIYCCSQLLEPTSHFALQEQRLYL